MKPAVTIQVRDDAATHGGSFELIALDLANPQKRPRIPAPVLKHCPTPYCARVSIDCV